MQNQLKTVLREESVEAIVDGFLLSGEGSNGEYLGGNEPSRERVREHILNSQDPKEDYTKRFHRILTAIRSEIEEMKKEPPYSATHEECIDGKCEPCDNCFMAWEKNKVREATLTHVQELIDEALKD